MPHFRPSTNSSVSSASHPTCIRKLAGALTVFSKQSGINSTLAPRQVLLALPDVTEANVDAYLAQREEMLAQDRRHAVPAGRRF